LQKFFKARRKNRSGGHKFILARAVLLGLVRAAAFKLARAASKADPPNPSMIYPYFCGFKRQNLLKFIPRRELLSVKNVDEILIEPKALARDKKSLQPEQKRSHGKPFYRACFAYPIYRGKAARTKPARVAAKKRPSSLAQEQDVNQLRIIFVV